MDRGEQEKLHMKSTPLVLEVCGEVFRLWPKTFSSGSLGWYAQGKMSVADTKCQCSFIITVIGSKPANPPIGSSSGSTPTEKVDSQPSHGTAHTELSGKPPTVSPLFPEETTPKTSGKRQKRS